MTCVRPPRPLTSLSQDCVHQLAKHAGNAHPKSLNTTPRIKAESITEKEQNAIR